MTTPITTHQPGCTCPLVQVSDHVWIRECRADEPVETITCQECGGRFELHEWFYGHDCEV